MAARCLTRIRSDLVEIPSLPKRLKRAGTPSLIVLSPSGIRAADVVRALKSVRVPEGEDGAETGKPPGEVGKVNLTFKAQVRQEHHADITVHCSCSPSTSRRRNRLNTSMQPRYGLLPEHPDESARSCLIAVCLEQGRVNPFPDHLTIWLAANLRCSDDSTTDCNPARSFLP